MLVPMTDNSDITAPLSLHTGQVLPDWIDYNGHMNLAYYMLAFDHATDAFFDFVGLGVNYLKEKMPRPSRLRRTSHMTVN